jgi:sialate O-acetylesterase
LWYQGESDSGLAYEYRVALRLLIEDWRERWKQEHLPFYICQLPAYGPKKPATGESEWAEVRESQAAVLNLTDTAMAVLIDLGESGDIHPRNKQEVGDRLAALVFAKRFSPVYDSMKVEEGKIRVKFRHTEGGLTARPLPAVYDVSTLLGQTAPLVRNNPGSELEGFSICGEDRRWVWANAEIDGASVVVWSPQVPQPVAVRYGWADDPTVNLFNRAGLPAAPFRTDDFPPLTVNRHFGL